LPVKEGIPLIGDHRLTNEDFQQSGISATLTQSPSGLNLTDATAFPEYQPWFVIIRADSLIPANKSGEVYSMQKDVFVRYNNITRYRIIPNPRGSESLVVPKYNYSWKDPQISETRDENIKYSPYRVPEETITFLDYMTSPSANVTISFTYSGSNNWNEGDDAWYYNSYHETFSERFEGVKNGGYFISGFIQSDEYGWYPNLSYPLWQKLLNQTPPHSSPY